MKKNIYSLKPLHEIVSASNNRYLEFISAIEDDSIGHKKLEKATEPKKVGRQKLQRIKLLLQSRQNHCTHTGKRGIQSANRRSFRCKDLAKHLKQYSSDQLSRLLKRLRVHGIIKKIGNSYKYYLPRFGKEIITCSQKVINMVMLPQLSKTA